MIDVTKMNEWELGAEMLFSLKKEEYSVAEIMRLEIKRRIDIGIIDGILFGEMISSKSFTEKIDPICFFE